MKLSFELRIVCGDCAGYDLLPRQTYLTKDNCCSGCGGRSYALAAEVCRNLRRAIAQGVDREELEMIAKKPVVGRARPVYPVFFADTGMSESSIWRS
jgi:hypothetical protein